MKLAAIAVVFCLALVPADAAAQVVVTTEILSGYLLPESNFLVTARPVVQTDIYVPGVLGLFADIWDSHQLYDPTKLFGAPGDEVDLTGGWIGAIGPWLLRAQAAWWDIAGSGNNFGDAKATLSRSFGDWAPLVGVEDQYIIPRRKHMVYVHGGSDVVFRLFTLPFQERFTLSVESTGRITFADALVTALNLGGIIARPILRLSADDQNRGPYATFGLRFVL
ncbi:MAG: hypothetical protein KGO48_02070 [Alphaproteobacteria bacterium]|nr:hypothetical protein [Alphaproteobacteria bacterium]